MTSPSGIYGAWTWRHIKSWCISVRRENRGILFAQKLLRLISSHTCLFTFLPYYKYTWGAAVFTFTASIPSLCLLPHARAPSQPEQHRASSSPTVVSSATSTPSKSSWELTETVRELSAATRYAWILLIRSIALHSLMCFIVVHRCLPSFFS